ncbi:hypothetical protein FRC17_010506 [Serendipita sp. 399]|nr:hypothetical protein FRC17_010506 [Serendipita sp. 399]
MNAGNSSRAISGTSSSYAGTSTGSQSTPQSEEERLSRFQRSTLPVSTALPESSGTRKPAHATTNEEQVPKLESDKHQQRQHQQQPGSTHRRRNTGDDSRHSQQQEQPQNTLPSIVTNPATPSISPTRTSSPIEVPWKTNLLRGGSSRSPVRSPLSLRADGSWEDSNAVRSTAVEASRRTSSPGLPIGSNHPIRSSSPATSSSTSLYEPPRSPVISPLPKLMPDSSSPRRNKSPVVRSDSPLAQSISPIPGVVSESGAGILAARLSPTPSPVPSPSMEIPNPLSPKQNPSSLLPKVDEIDDSSDSSETTVPSVKQALDYFQDSGSDSTPTGSSPMHSEEEPVYSPAVYTPPISIDPNRDPEAYDDQLVSDPDIAQMDEEQAMILEDERLTALEKIYLYSRSAHTFHRIYISKQLPFLIREVPPAEAVEYVCPLLNGLGTDAEESVKEVFVQELVPVIWWFLMNCQVVDHSSQEPYPATDAAYLPSDAFTPLIGSLLLSANPRVGDGARLAIVELLNRLQKPENAAIDDRYAPPSPSTQFGDTERDIIINEIMNGVVLGMGRLDSEFQDGSDPINQQELPSEQLGTQRSSAPSPEERAHVGIGSRQPRGEDETSPQPTGLGLHDYFDSHSPRRITTTADDDDGWITAPPQTPEEELEALSSIVNAPTPRSLIGDLDPIQEEPASNDTSEEATVGRVASMSVVAAIAANATMPLSMQEVFVQEVWRVGSDPVYWVRREASFAIGALAKVVPLELITGYLLPLYEMLVQDEQWHVRHSVLFALPGILARIDATQRRLLTVPSLVQLSRDPADPVRSGLLEVLGEVIYTFRDDPGGPPLELINLFVPPETAWAASEVLPSPATQTWLNDAERPIICAFNFPAVILTLGASRWSELRGYYLHLTQNSAGKVQRTLAASIGEVAAIVGPRHTEEDLLPIFFCYLRSNEPEVRAKLIEALPKFFEVLPEPKKELILEELRSMWLQLSRWREREDLARRLGDLVPLSGNRADLVVELLDNGVRDEVSAVRDAAISALPKFLKALNGNPQLKRVMDLILSLATDTNYRRRVTFVACVLSIIQAAEDPAFMNALPVWKPVRSDLVRDPIVDVRIGVARLVARACERFYGTYQSRPKYLRELINALTADESSQVQAYVAFLVTDLDVNVATAPSHMNESGFAVFSKPPRVVPSPLETDQEFGEIANDSQVEETGQDAVPPPLPDIIETPPPQNEVTSEPRQQSGFFSPSWTEPPLPLKNRPLLMAADSGETLTSGSSRGEESQPSPVRRDAESPRRSGQARRNAPMSLGDLPLPSEYGSDFRQSPSQAASTPSPGSERRISFDTLSIHSDGSDSSGRAETKPLARRSSLHECLRILP